MISPPAAAQCSDNVDVASCTDRFCIEPNDAMDASPSPASPAPALLSPPHDPRVVLMAPDLDSAERAYLGLLPDRDHVDALARHAISHARNTPGSGYALSLTLVGMRLQEFKMGEACATTCRQDSLQSLRQAFAAG